MEEKNCIFCGEKIHGDAVICVHCGRQVEKLNFKEKGMGWFNFVGKFLLIFWSIMCLLNQILSVIDYMKSYAPLNTDITFFGLLILQCIIGIIFPIYLFALYLNKNKNFSLYILLYFIVYFMYDLMYALFTVDIETLFSNTFADNIGKFSGTILGYIIFYGLNIAYFYKRIDVFNKNQNNHKNINKMEVK